MRNARLFRIFAGAAIVFASLFSIAFPVEAMGFATVGTTLTIDPPDPVAVGTPTNIILHLISSKNLPVANQRVELYVNGERWRSAKTDATGTASIRITRDTADTYQLFATFKGSKLPSLGSSKATSELIVSPAMVEIQTTPALPGIKFSLSGKIFSSDDYGVARIEVPKAGKYRLELLPVETKDADIQMDFGRWGDENFEPNRDIEIPVDKPLQIGFEVSYQVSQTFIDLEERPVDPARVTSITLKGSNGTTYTFEDNKPHWLPAGRIIRLNNGLEQTRILYSIISVVIDGSNVVSQAQQRYFVNPNDVWPVKLLLYKATFNARDALFGFPLGTGIRMQYPDGDVQTYTFSTNQEYTLDGLARGIYRVTVLGADGYAPPTPIALSRDQDVELMVFSTLDIGVLVGLGLLLSLGLLLFGRPYIVTQTIGLAARLIPGRRGGEPAVRPQFSQILMALGARLFPQRRRAELAHAAAEEQSAEETFQGTPLEAGQDLPVSDSSDPEQNPRRRNRRKRRVENPV